MMIFWKFMDGNYLFASSFYRFAPAVPSRCVGQTREAAAAAATAANLLAIYQR